MQIDRRDLIATAVATVPILAITGRASAVDMPSSSSPDLTWVRTASDFAGQVMPRATLSIAASQSAVRRLQRADALEFAGFELEEALAVTSVLKDLGVPVPQITGPAQVALESILRATDGPDFDRAYMKAQYENHAYLARLAAAYLSQSGEKTEDEGERHGRHLAAIALFAFNEHTTIARRISEELHV